MITPRELGWVAGFLEGEGSFRYRVNTLHVSAAQKQLEPLERIQRILGGKIHRRSANKRGIYVWECYGALGAGVMMTMYSMMSPRRRQQISTAIGPWKIRRTRAQYWVDRRAITHCRRGHPYVPENTYTYRGMRTCRECVRIKDEKRRRKQGLPVRGRRKFLEIVPDSRQMPLGG